MGVMDVAVVGFWLLVVAGLISIRLGAAYGVECESAEFGYHPNTRVAVSEADREQLAMLLDNLDQNEHVLRTFHNSE